MVGQTNINDCRVSEMIKQNMLKSKKIMSKFVSELLKYCFWTYPHIEDLKKEMPSYNIVLCCSRNHYSKYQINRIIKSYKNVYSKKVKNEHV